jgi:hypothetical protein
MNSINSSNVIMYKFTVASLKATTSQNIQSKLQNILVFGIGTDYPFIAAGASDDDLW